MQLATDPLRAGELSLLAVLLSPLALMKAAAVLVLLSIPAFADEGRASLSIGPGLMWNVPLTRGRPEYEGVRQDLGVSWLAQVDSAWWLAQVEIGLGGVTASNPEFKFVEGRVGAFINRGALDVSISAGAGYMTYSASTSAECAQIGCDIYNGNGLVVTAELAARARRLPIPAGVFVGAVLPLFDVTSTSYPGIVPTRAVGVVVLGGRLYL